MAGPGDAAAAVACAGEHTRAMPEEAGSPKQPAAADTEQLVKVCEQLADSARGRPKRDRAPAQRFVPGAVGGLSKVRSAM